MGTIDKRPLFGYARLDGQGRLVAGSLILRRKMPKVGKWVVMSAYQCCGPTTTTTTTAPAPATTTSTSTSTTTHTTSTTTTTTTHHG